MKNPATSRLLLFLCGLALIFGSGVRAAANPSSPNLFEPESLKKIEQAYAGQPFLLVMWSLDCPPCREELALLSEFSKQHRDFKLVLVSTDAADASAQVAEVLAEQQLNHVESWVFSEAGADRLRYEIDPDWYGEIPRSYFYDQNHQRTAVSGALKKQQIVTWLSDTAKKSSGR